eukprot:5610384-Prymnesium_polylepis.1
MQPRLMPTKIAVALPPSSSLHTCGLKVSDDRCVAPVETNTSISMSCNKPYVAMRSAQGQQYGLSCAKRRS